ncbi:2OG-Fe(II) oxygenase [Microvirga terricola]|uniref:2OG-Fe(II) oxygenase n=1 Tax=Microvirga terricola TaxID=2719797 RepID=A0ABX0V9Z6_9HYPH|nr:2OG-Fe(II) oxygenase [Microvirga terricola]NIX75510.1 2OG-Fe(II) oxygenase [Microvirga terricola]
MTSLLNTEAISQSRYSAEPYPHFLGAGLLREEAIPALRRDFPNITKPGYLTVDDVDLKGSFRALIDQLESPELTEVLSKRFGIDLHPYPRLTTIMKQSQPKYGVIHTDGPSKVMTMLVYMNDAWQEGEGGRLRALYNGTDYEPYACEVPPTMGTVFGFLRTDNSWHGHRPFAGERRVVQIAWIKDQKELERKRRRNGFAQILKGVFGR